MSGPVDAYWFTTQAKKCRQLARGVDERTAKILDEMAAEYDAQAIRLDESAC